MPIREFGCYECRKRTEVIHPSLDPNKVPAPECPGCGALCELLISCPVIDTSSTFNRAGGGAFTYQGPTGLYHEIDTLHKLRQVEHAYLESGHDIRFDAWSAEPSNPDVVDGFGPEYWDGDKSHSKGNPWVQF